VAGEHFFQRFWSNLKERHVTRIAVAYLGVGWGVLETLEFTLGLLQAPDWIFRAGVALVGLGFPVALVLSWIFDIRGGQVVRTDGKTSRWSTWVKAAVSAPVLVLVVVSSYWVWTGYVEEKERSLRPTDLGDEVPIVAVLPIRNLTGDPELDWFGEGIVNLVRDNLSRSRFLRIASPQKLKAIVGDATDELEIAELAAEQDIGFIMAGEMLMTPAGIYVSSRLTDTAGGVVLSAKQVENLEPATILEAAGPIAAQIRRGLGVPREEQVDVFVADFAIDNQEAYERYVDGITHLAEFEIDPAAEDFQAALKIAPDFGVAHYRLGLIKWIRSETDQALLEFDRALADPFLLDRERQYIEAIRQYAAGEYPAAEQALDELLQEYPFDLEAREILAKLYWDQFRSDEAINEMQQLAVEEPHNLSIMAWLGSFHRWVGNLEAAEDAYLKLQNLAPDAPNTLRMMGLLRRDYGDLEGAKAYFRQALAVLPDMRDVRYDLAVIEYLQGRIPEAEQEFRLILDNQDLLIRDRLEAMFDLASLLESRGDFKGAIELLVLHEDAIKAERIRYALSQSMIAMNWLQLADPERARKFADIALENTPTVPTRYLFALANIELAENRYSEVLAIADKIEGLALPLENPDRTEEKAAAYLRGLASLAQDQVQQAQLQFEQARALEGYSYALYELAYAQAALRAGQPQEVLEILKTGIAPDPAGPRVDLERDRVRAILVRAEAHQALGDMGTAEQLALEFMARFHEAPDNHPLRKRAQGLIDRDAVEPLAFHSGVP